MELLPPPTEPDQPLASIPAMSPEFVHTDAYSYLSQSKFHRMFKCPRTDRRVTYADVGDPDGSPLLYFLPSGCTRWVALALEEVAREKKIRVLAMDRPGSGGTEMCPLNERVRITCDMTESLLELLGIEHLALLAASGGVIHLLEYIRLHPGRLSPTHPTVLLVSPWAPGNQWLPLIPSSLMLIEHRVIPVVQPPFQTFTNALVVSSHQLSFLVTSSSSSASPKRTFLTHPYAQATGLLEKFLWTESQRGLGQEHLLCVGKGIQGSGTDKIGSKAWYAETIGELRAALLDGTSVINRETAAAKIQVYAWWGDKDVIVPRKAREFFDRLMDSSGGVQYHRVELADAGHGVPLFSMDGMGEALEIVRARCSGE